MVVMDAMGSQVLQASPVLKGFQDLQDLLDRPEQTGRVVNGHSTRMAPARAQTAGIRKIANVAANLTAM
jgi:hypothetical protein